MKKFQELPLSEESLAALDKLGIVECTSVQEESIEAMLAGRDMIVQAPTGTGKTYAFGLPLIERCDREEQSIQALVLAPTRELVQQITHEFEELLAEHEGLSVLPIFGGAGMAKQIAALKNSPQILVATPGRLLDHMQRRRLSLSQIRILILDEADRMLDMGFIDDVRKIMDQIPKSAQIGLYSATLSREVMDISWLYQKSPMEVRIEAVEEDKPDILQYVVHANGAERILAIRDILKKENGDKALVFVNMKQSAEITAQKLSREGFRAAALQGDLPQSQRNRVMRSFREGDIDILVCTDVAARGLDIDDVDFVFNYDLPVEKENYTHRIGRTGRARRQGKAFSFIVEGSEAAFEQFCRQLRIEVEPYPWEAPDKQSETLSSEKEAEIIAKIRARSQWLQIDEAVRYDPMGERRRPSGSRRGGDSRYGSSSRGKRPPRGQGNSGRTRSSGAGSSRRKRGGGRRPER